MKTERTETAQTLRPPAESNGSESPLYRLSARIEQAESLDGSVDVLERALPPALTAGTGRRLLGGNWLGHALHPLLTDFALGAWMSATLLDLFGSRRAAPAATGLIAFGVAAAVPTAVSGASDWSTAERGTKRVGVVHAATNMLGLACYAVSLIERLRGRRAAGIAYGLAGGVIVTAGGYLGGHLSVLRGVGVTPTPSPPRP